MSNDNPSQMEANKMVRVLSGTRLKYTIHVHKPDGSITEFQSESGPEVEWFSDPRKFFITVKLSKEYSADKVNVMEWEPGTVILAEINPML